MAEWVNIAVLIGLFVIGLIGGLIVHELRKIHTRIDKYAGEMDDHIKEGVQVHAAQARIETKIDMHLGNQHVHAD